MKKILFIGVLFLSGRILYSQNIGINSNGALPHTSAMLDVNAAPANNTGILIPRISLTAVNNATPVASPATSLLVYNTATAGSGTTAVSPGYYYWDGAKWVRMQTSATIAGDWNLLGNAGTTPGTNFIGTTDAKDLVFKTNNIEAMRTTTAGNVGIGTASPNASAKLDLTSTTQGFAMPRMTTTQRIAISAPTDGLQVYDTNLGGIYRYSTINNKWDCANNPAGTINYFANITAPIGYLECNGQSVSATQYPELFNAIGYTYGGSGANFNVPDLRGEFIRGADNARGVDPGRALGSAQADAFRSHLHTVDPPNTVTDAQGNHTHAITTMDVIDEALVFFINDHSGDYVLSSDNAGTPGAGELKVNRYYTEAAGSHQHNLDISSFNSGNTGGTETRPRNIALMPCIKF